MLIESLSIFFPVLYRTRSMVKLKRITQLFSCNCAQFRLHIKFYSAFAVRAARRASISLSVRQSVSSIYVCILIDERFVNAIWQWVCVTHVEPCVGDANIGHCIAASAKPIQSPLERHWKWPGTVRDSVGDSVAAAACFRQSNFPHQTQQLGTKSVSYRQDK